MVKGRNGANKIMVDLKGIILGQPGSQRRRRKEEEEEEEEEEEKQD